ncbi:unnamed protein product [Zymoseptoria tritici ST99CH_3D7]|uniref:Zn(2)-C6 fungal-type domain-containing protein n=1 Tax=Zymoseptoria tritici (strain ST99CH_3D7) TaxID=1276538 RepID=A0A1X7S9G6_ZYMT9|nr:unnamed protein product [Zymoseptoria tritici ST99CH_3D7]
MLTKQEPSVEPIDRARAYKSRNKRPCDFCRYKKAACHLETAPPCELCVRYGKECTFVESPAKRRRPNEQTRNAAIEDIKANLSLSREICSDTGRNPSIYGHDSNHARTAGMDLYPPPPLHHQDHLLSWEAGLPSFAMDPTLAQDFPFDPQLFAEPLAFDTFEPASASASSTLTFQSPDIFSHASHESTDSLTSPPSQCAGFLPALTFESTAFEPSPEREHASYVQIVGISGELDPCLLSKYEYDEDNETKHHDFKIRKTSAVSEEHAGKTTADQTFLLVKSKTYSTSGAFHWRQDLEKLVPSAQGAGLVDLFYKHIHPVLPILPQSTFSSTSPSESEFPPHLSAAVYAHALSFVPSDAHPSIAQPSKSGQLQERLLAFSYAALQSAIQTPDVTVIQTLLLHLKRGHDSGALDSASTSPHSRLPHETDAAKWTMMCQTLGLAQGLGLDQNCASWTTISRAERKLRKRLAWAVWVTEKWLATGLGRRSLSGKIGEDWEVPYLTAKDFHEDGGRGGQEADAHDSLSPAPSSSPKNILSSKKRKWDSEETEVKEADPGHFIHLCTLTEIVDDILTELYSPTAMRTLAGNLENTLEVAKPLRLRLGEWHRGLPADLSATLTTTASTATSPSSALTPSIVEQASGPSTASLDHSASPIVEKTSTSPATSPSSCLPSMSPEGTTLHYATAQPSVPYTSLHLSYITAKILIFRALLRASTSLSIPKDNPYCPALEALRVGSLATAHEIISFVSNLPPQAYASALWPAYATQQIGTASSFLLLLAHTTDGGHGAEAREVVMEWTDVLRARAPQFGVLRSGLNIVEHGMERLPGNMGKSER